MIVSQYEPQRFEGLLSFGEACDARATLDKKAGGEDDTLGRIGALICEHGLNEIVGVTMLHKHFEINPNEQLVRRYSDRIGRIQPETWSDENVPCILAFDLDDTSKLVPIEFSNRSLNPEAEKDYDALVANSEFLRRCGEIIRERRVHKIYGLASVCPEI